MFLRFTCISVITYLLIVPSNSRNKFTTEDIKYYRPTHPAQRQSRTRTRVRLHSPRRHAPTTHVDPIPLEESLSEEMELTPMQRRSLHRISADFPSGGSSTFGASGSSTTTASTGGGGGSSLPSSSGVLGFSVTGTERAVRMFQHAYNGYLNHAYPYDELRPITCDGHDTWGSYSLTLVDALDTLAVMGNNTEFQRVAGLLIEIMDFDRDINVSVFETNIRVVGGLLSGHLLSQRAGMTVEPGWPCSGPLLRMAEDAARRLLPAFNTTTGMPYGTVNLRHGVPSGETTITCTAGVTTYIVEFGALSRLTGDPVFEKVAMKALSAMWDTRSEINLVGNHIDVNTGRWTAVDAGIGAQVDSYFEYLVKGAIMFHNSQLMEWFNSYVGSIEKYLKREDWYLWANMKKGTVSLPVFQSLEAFWPGMQSLVGDIDKAMKTIHNYHQVWKQYGFSPEFYSIPKSEVHSNRESYPLRPELIESTMYLYQATKDPYLLEIGVDILESIEHSAKTPCGYATIRDVRNHQKENRMESFFLAETTKYLYLLFDTDNFIHNTGGKGTVIQTPNGECVIDAGGYVFNTEAHPLDTAAIYCCSAEKKSHDQMIQSFHDNVDLLALLGLVEPKKDVFSSPKNKKSKQEAPAPTQEQDQVTVNLGKNTNIELPDVVVVDDVAKATNKNEGRVRVALPPPGGESEFESRVKKLLQDVRLSPATKDDVVDRILNTLNDAVKDVQASTEQEVKIEVAKVDLTVDEETEIHTTQPDHEHIELGVPVVQKLDGGKDTENTENTENKETLQNANTQNKGANKEGDDETCSPEDKEFEESIADEDQVHFEDNVKARLLTCPSQPFYMRLSLMGEMFIPRL